MSRTVVYSNLKVFDFAGRLKRDEGPLAPPVHVRIKPTNACNQNCSFCAYRCGELHLGDDMNVRDRIGREKMREIVEDLVAMKVGAVTFSGGGEPLVYPYLAETIAGLAEGNIRIGCLSNGSALDGELADAFARHGTWLRISMDAWDGQSYSRSRSVQPRVFERVCDNIRRFAGRRTGCTLGISFIVTHENAEHVFEACRLMKSLGAQHFKISPCIVADDPAGNNRYHEAIAPRLESEIERCKALEDGSFEVLDHYHRLPELFERPYDRCRMLQFLTVIGADLGLYTCQDKAYTPGGFLGSLADRRFRDLWFSSELAEKIRGFDPRQACRHHCVSHVKNLLLAEFDALDPGHAAFV